MGIDASLTSTGIVVLDGDKILLSRAIVTKPGDYTVPIARFAYIRTQIVNEINKHNPEAIYLEGFSFGSKGQAVMQIGMLGGLIREALEYARATHVGLTWKEIPPTVLKKFATGKGNSKKEDMRLAAYKKWGIELKSNDEIDAYCLARLAQNKGEDK